MNKIILLLGLIALFTEYISAQPNLDMTIKASWSSNIQKEGRSVGEKFTFNETINKLDGRLSSKASTDNIIWKYHIKVDDVVGVIAFFDHLVLGKGSKIRAYNPLTKNATRFFFENSNTNTTSFALPFLKGNELVIEAIFDNQKTYDLFEIAISEVGGLYSLNENGSASKGFGDAPTCFANVNCSEGNPWQDQKRSVAKYMTVLGNDIGFCTGSLVNNTNDDCKNYFLSAQHCALGSSTSELGQFVFYFNYESHTCESPANDNGLADETVVGCTKIAESGGSTTFPPDCSDFLLVELNPVPNSYNVYYAGWNREPLTQLQGNGAIIQHPQGDLKKISFWDNVTVSGTSVSHLYAYCIASANGDGTTEPQASGSPIFDVNNQIIGNITAGDAGCISNLPTDPFIVGGRFEIHWDQCGTAANRQLVSWLDPMNTGVMSLDGKNQNVTVGVDNRLLDQSLIQVFPNPTTGRINVQSTEKINLIKIYSVEGKLLLETQESNNIDVSNLQAGMILVIISTDKGLGYKKIIISR